MIIVILILCTILSDYIYVLIRHRRMQNVALRENVTSRTHCICRTHINAFVLVPVHATAYCRHIGNNCLSFIEGVRIFDN